MNILVRKEELEFILLTIDGTDGRKYKSTKNIFKQYRNDIHDIIIDVEKEVIYDLYEIIKEFQDNCFLDDIRLFELEDKLIRFINDIKANKYGWNGNQSKDKNELDDLEGDINGGLYKTFEV